MTAVQGQGRVMEDHQGALFPLHHLSDPVKEQGGIEKAEIEQLLDRIEQGTAQIETDNNLDEEDQKLMEEIRNQVKGARDMTAMAYGA